MFGILEETPTEWSLLDSKWSLDINVGSFVARGRSGTSISVKFCAHQIHYIGRVHYTLFALLKIYHNIFTNMTSNGIEFTKKSHKLLICIFLYFENVSFLQFHSSHIFMAWTCILINTITNRRRKLLIYISDVCITHSSRYLKFTITFLQISQAMGSSLQKNHTSFSYIFIFRECIIFAISLLAHFHGVNLYSYKYDYE